MYRWFLLLFMVIFSGFASAEIVLDDGLLLQGGETQIIMNSGEKVYLKVQDSIWKYPVIQGLEFSSKYPWIAYVDQYGWIHAGIPGRTVVSVWNEAGDNGTIEILVQDERKTSLRLLLLFVGTIGVIFLFFLQKNSWN